MKNLSKLCVFTLIAALPLINFCVSLICYANPFNKPLQVISFANYLMKEKDYVRAVSEYNRYLRMDVPVKLKLTAYKNKITCSAKLRDFSSVRKDLLDLASHSNEPEITPDFWLCVARILEKESDFQDAAFAYDMCSKVASETDASTLASLYEAKMYYLMGKDNRALDILTEMQAKNISGKYGDTIAFMNRNKMKWKSARFAMGLSAIIPGSGHIYAGETFHGISSFIMNAGLISAAYFSFKNDSPILGSFLGYLEADFYIGGIKTAGFDAKRTNRKMKRLFIKNLNVRLPLEPRFCIGKDFQSVQLVYHF